MERRQALASQNGNRESEIRIEYSGKRERGRRIVGKIRREW